MQRNNQIRKFPRKEMRNSNSFKKDEAPKPEITKEPIFKGLNSIIEALKRNALFRPGIHFKGHLERVLVQKKSGIPHVTFVVGHIPVQQVLSAGTRRGNTLTGITPPEMELPTPGLYKVKNIRFEHDRKTGKVSIVGNDETAWHPIRA